MIWKLFRRPLQYAGFDRLILWMHKANILCARKSSFDEPIAEDVTISWNIRCIHSFGSRYTTLSSPQQLPNFIRVKLCVFKMLLVWTVFLVHLTR